MQWIQREKDIINKPPTLNDNAVISNKNNKILL